MIIAVFSHAQKHNLSEVTRPLDKTFVFRFVADDNTFFIPFLENGETLSELVTTIDLYKDVITKIQATLNAVGYYSSYTTVSENLKSVAVRANRLKSELIARNGIKEEYFHTSASTTSFEGRKSVVGVTLCIPGLVKVANDYQLALRTNLLYDCRLQP
ncbi:hypothetical protein [Dysgonomonas mossii]|uniref:hypothetical protein n=1 Tax=Dysgonomonas mossii TaxID=163665 RepID=UPI003996A3A9